MQLFVFSLVGIVAAMPPFYPETWAEFQRQKTFVINLDRCTERLATTLERLRTAGFTNVERFSGVDAGPGAKPNATAEAVRDTKKRLATAWENHGSPKMDSSDTEFCETALGKQGCMLAHLNLLKHVIAEKIPFFIVFEDDVLFHPHWDQLAPTYYEKTPKDYDLLYLGSQLEIPDMPFAISQAPVYCTNAMALTLEGAVRIYEFLLTQPKGVRTIDCILKDHQIQCYFLGARHAFEWYVWNATMFPGRPQATHEWAIRNTGLVFQDETFGSEVAVYKKN